MSGPVDGRDTYGAHTYTHLCPTWLFHPGLLQAHSPRSVTVDGWEKTMPCANIGSSIGSKRCKRNAEQLPIGHKYTGTWQGGRNGSNISLKAPPASHASLQKGCPIDMNKETRTDPPTSSSHHLSPPTIQSSTLKLESPMPHPSLLHFQYFITPTHVPPPSVSNPRSPLQHILGTSTGTCTEQ